MKFIAAFIFLSILVSCKKSNTEVQININTFTDNNKAIILSDDVFSIANYYINKINYCGYNSDSLPTLTITPLYPTDSFPKTIILDFKENLLYFDNKTYSGKLFITIYNNFELSNDDSFFVSAERFKIDSVLFNCSALAKVSESDLLKFNVKSSIYIIDSLNNKFSQINNEFDIEKVSGINTLSFVDDAYLISGKSSGINSNNKAYQAEIKIPLKFDNSCSNGIITQGEFNIFTESENAQKINYGAGNCDRKVTITYNDKIIDVMF